MAKDKQLVVRVDADTLNRVEIARAQLISRSQHTVTVSEAVRQLLDLGLRSWETYQANRYRNGNARKWDGTIGQAKGDQDGTEETPD